MFAVLVLSFAPVQLAFSQHIITCGERVPLRVDSSTCRITFTQGSDSRAYREILSAVTDRAQLVDSALVIRGYHLVSLDDNNDYFAFLDSLRSSSGIGCVEPSYTWEDGEQVLFTGAVCTRFLSSVTRQRIDSLAQSYRLSVVEPQIAGSEVRLLQLTPETEVSVVDVANSLAALPETEWAHPETVVGPMRSSVSYKPFDYYGRYQDHIKKIIGDYGVATVWDFHGLTRQVEVAVLDDGFVAHEDLPSDKWLSGWDAADQDLDVSPSPFEAHGMACAGLLAANHSLDSGAFNNRNSGIMSIAPNAKIRPVKVFSTDSLNPEVTDSEIADGINWAWQQGAQVLSNSWNFVYRTQFDCVNAAINAAVTYGRDGKGTLVIFSAGNRGVLGVEYPANLDDCLAIGATNLNDSIFGYSAFDSLYIVDLVAPSDFTNATGQVWTIDQMGSAGYNRKNGLGKSLTDIGDTCWYCPDGDDLDYNCAFGGTSAAAPLVSGVAALLLAKDADLTVTELTEILKQSAVQPSFMGVPPQVPHHKYGWGRVDAFRAVLSIAHGDVNNDGFVADVSDLSALIAYLNNPAQKPFPSVRLGDWNCSGGAVDLTDLSLCIAWVTGQQGRVLPVKPCFKY